MPRIQANRDAIDDRFSVLGFTVRTESPLFEIGVATDPQLFHANRRGERNRRNFFSSRAAGAMRARRGEAVYLLPPDVLTNFIGQPKLYFGLATYPERSRGAPDFVQAPTAGNMYVSMAGLTERGLRRLTSSARTSSYGQANGRDPSLEWGGDAWPQETASPGSSATPNGGVPTTGSLPAEPPMKYDDGFGAFPDAAARSSNGTATVTPETGPAAAAQGLRRATPRYAVNLANDVSDEGRGIEGPIPDLPGDTATIVAPQALGAPGLEYPQASRFVPAAPENYRAMSSPRTIDKIVLHITDGGANINGTIAWFRNPQAQVSAHYVIGQDGEIVQMVLHNDKAWHARSANTTSIGIEHVANTKGLRPTGAQLCASAALVTWLCDQYGIPCDRQHILGHSEADTSTTHTGCPNAVWDWAHYMQMIDTRSCIEPAAAVAQSLELRRGGRALVRAQEIIQPFYDPADPASALTCQNDAFSQAREEWFVGVPNTRMFPHSAICKLRMTGPDGSMYGGTGFYIGRNRILTCAHNLHGMSQVTIIPGRNGASDKPYGECTVQSSGWRIAPGYTGSGNWANDIAVIDNVPIAAPDNRWFGFLNATPSDQLPVVVCGYSKASPAVPQLTRLMDGEKQHLHGGYVHGQSDFEVIEYPLLTLKGASGSPVYHLSDASGTLEALVCAVHVTGELSAQGLNRGCFITPAKIDWIEGRTTAFSLRPAPVRPRAKQLALTPAFTWPSRLGEGNYLVKAFVEAYNARVDAGVIGAPAPDPTQFRSFDADASTRSETLSRFISQFTSALQSESGRGDVNRAILAVTTAVSMQVFDEIRRLLPKTLYAPFVMRPTDPLPQPSPDFVLPRAVFELSARIGMLMAWIDVAIQKATTDTAERMRLQREQWEMTNAAAGAGFTILGLAPGLGTAMTFVGTLVQALIGASMPDFERSYASFSAAMRAVRRTWKALPATMLKGLIADSMGQMQLVGDFPLHSDVQGYLDAHAAQTLLGWENELAFLGFADSGAEPTYAQGLAARRRAQSRTLGTVSVHWDDVPFYPQTSPMSCWAASAAMVVGWRDRVSISDESIARMVPVIDGYRTGLWPSDRRKLADAWDLVAEPPASYTIEAWAQMLEAHGPLYLDMTWSGDSGGHVRVLVGIESDGVADGSGTTMFMHDPWPDTPGKIKLSFADFLTLYEGRTGNSGGELQYQILHADFVPAGVRPVTVAPFALTLAEEAEPAPVDAPVETLDGVPVRRSPISGSDATTTTRARGLTPPPVPVVQQQQLRSRMLSAAADGVEVDSPIAGAKVRRIDGGNDEVRWQLDQLHGFKHPNDQPPAEVRTAADGEVVHLSSWPCIDADDGTRVALAIDVRWQHDGLAVGNVRVQPVQVFVSPGYTLAVRATIADDRKLYPSDQPTCAAVAVRVDYRFTQPDGEPLAGSYDVQLFGNGRFNLAGRWLPVTEAATPASEPRVVVTA